MKSKLDKLFTLVETIEMVTKNPNEYVLELRIKERPKLRKAPDAR